MYPDQCLKAPLEHLQIEYFHYLQSYYEFQLSHHRSLGGQLRLASSPHHRSPESWPLCDCNKASRQNYDNPLPLLTFQQKVSHQEDLQL